MASRSAPGFVAVSTNPAIDRVARFEGAAGGIVAATELLETPGGKAVHAACVAAELGAEVAVIATAGGRSGDQLLTLLASEPLAVYDVRVAGSTRGTYTLVEATGGEVVEVHEPAANLTEPEVDRLASALLELPAAPRVVAVCGSLPPGTPANLHARLIATARELGAYSILDCSSTEALAAGVAEGPDLVGPNLAEAGRLLGVEFAPGLTDLELAAITEAIRDLGAATVWLSLGADGSVLATGEGSFRLTAPAPERVVNSVGCGDALIGGLAAGLTAGRDLLAAAALGTAAATEKLNHLHPGEVDRSAVEALVPLVEVTALQRRVTAA